MTAAGPSGLSNIHLVVAILCLCLPTLGVGQVGVIRFAQQQLLVDEGSTRFTAVQIPLVRDGGTSGAVVVTITLVDRDNDFISESIVTTFADGSAEAQATAVIRNDAIPEGNETFTLTISDLSSGVIGSINSMQLIIRANDQPYGMFQYDIASLSLEVLEPQSAGNTFVTLTVTRGPGTFGRVAVEYEIVPSVSSFGMDDISPTRGQLAFAEGATAATISLTVNPDSIPEPAELFFVHLMNPSGGAVLAQGNTTAMVTIQANDAPISWSQALTTVDEDIGLFQLMITRGVLADGSLAGDLALETTVTVTTNSGSASSGSDFIPISLLVTFAPGSSSMPVPVTIVDDSFPEGDEMFTVVLSSPSSDAVLYPPSTATILISVNDNAGGLAFFASPGPVIIREDEQTIGQFTVRRTVGTFGNLTAEWQITSNQGTLASSDFIPARGNVTIFDGAADAFLDIVAFDDTVPEVSEGFTVELVRVVSEFGGLSDSSPRLASLIVAESDDVYGLLEWAEDESLSVAGSAPRELRLVVDRTGDSIGIVAVEYNIVYLPPQGVASTLMFTGSVEFQGGQSSRDFSVTLPDTAFLETGGNFMATIDNATLIGGANFLTPPVNSPRVGSRSVVLIPVPVEATSGFISFASQSLQVQVAEPDSAPSVIDLTVTRTGSFGTATITWAISASATSVGADVMDIGANAGLVVIPNGANSAVFSFTVRPDDTPEIDEVFIVTLIQVTEANQMILLQQNEAVVTILANDNPSGIFSISNSTSGPFLLTEDTNRILVVTIVRSRGDLTQELIQYSLMGQPAEIAGGQGIADFQPGERSKDITLFVTNDDIPEVNETFVFSILPLSPGVDVAAPSTVDITILSNDDFAGVFSFNTSSLSTSIVEPSNNSTAGPESTAVLSVVREAGAFGTEEVYWEVSNPSMDISEASGRLIFTEGQRSASLEISAEPDDDPEAAETYNVVLRSVSGEGRLASSSTIATVTILQNDDPIRFDRSFAQVEEGETAVFTLIRGGQANGVAEVVYSVAYQTASTSDVMLAPSEGVVILAPGQTQASITVTVLDDELPEEQELLVLSLVSVSGDAVLISPTQATLVIELSDDPNGLFAFDEDSLLVTAIEGDTVQLMVVRGGGSFGAVSLRWTVYSIQPDSNIRVIANSSDIGPVTGIVNFSPGDQTQLIFLTVQDDNTPELAETLEVELTIPTVEGVSISGARLDNDSSAFVMIQESDEPNGVLRIADLSTMVDVAEDVPSENMALGQAQLSVDRTFGTIGAVRALWEVLAVSDSILPDYVDLLFFGEQGTGVSLTTPRPNTGTSALRFLGQPGSVVTVPLQYHPVNISTGFTISIWLQPSPSANGMLFAKTSTSGLVYALSMVADGSNFLVRLTYQQSANGQLLGESTAEVSLPQSTLTDGMWHSLIVTVGQGSAVFYADSSFIDSRTLLSTDVGDEEGELTVGGQANTNFYTGALQDVRIYMGLLQPSQIEIVSRDTAALSLTLISGYISYPAGRDLATIAISSVDDTIPEPSEMFALSLTNVAGGARLSGTQDTAIITVLKSDSSNGVFGFTSDSGSRVIGEPGLTTLAVNRSEGTFDSVTIMWEVREASSGLVATQDFNPATGRVIFGDGEELQTFVITTLDETEPELSEEFVVVLTSAVANDNETSSTPLSGASIDASRSQSMLTVTENDFPYGVLQFSASPPIPGQPIALATVMPELAVEESDGTVMVYVVRAQGTVGSVNVEFFTSDDSATNLGLEPDYVSNAGQLSFGPGVIVQSFSVMLVDDADPELAKTFYVNLTNPQGDTGLPDLGIGQSMAITIQPSDDAFGRFSFSSASLSHIVAEQAGGAPISFTVLREGGTFGEVSVYWAVSQPEVEGQVMDVSPSTGVVMFAEGEREQQFTLVVTDDLVAELLEVFTVQLVNVTVGASITSVSSATITVQASDHPYGRFVFSLALRPLESVMESGRVQVVVTREFGALGQVMVDVQTVSSQNITLLTRLLDVQQLIDNSQLATTDEDYDATSETLIFESGQTSSSFYINITDDPIPEINEYLFAVITRVELNQDSLTSVDTSVLPSVAPGNDSLAIIIIAENDDARGVIQFSEATVTTSEPSQDFVSLQRTEGTFGNLTVQWEAISGTADGADFSPQGGTIIIPAQVTTVSLPIVILEDSIPEFSEQFMVRLLSVTGGGRLGPITTSTINIQASDDPNGAFEFATESRMLTVEEPEDGESPVAITLTVQRVGGSLGVVSVSWRVTSSNGDASDDILPVSGTLNFITATTEQSFVLSILPDTIPELDEVYSVELVSATGGGNIGTFPVANITVPSNDGPYGVIAFTAATAVATEVGDNGTSVSMLTISRSIGFFGDIRVLYNVQSTDAATLALADGTSLLSYFDPPVANLTLESSALLQQVSGFVSLDACGRACLSAQTCLAFSIAVSSGTCELFLATQTPDNRMPMEGVDFYQKQQDSVLPFYQSVASDGNDFSAAVGESVVIADGERSVSIPITIIGDDVPELNESLTVTLTGVELINAGEAVVSGAPILGSITETTLIILENDDPRGVFVITGSDGSSIVRVIEPDSFTFGITLRVERQRGSIGQVSVSWSVSGGIAQPEQDFIGTGATLVFEDGETQATIALVILADDIPEIDETLLVSLGAASGGARIAPGQQGTTTVIIDANDGVAGVVSLSVLSRSAVVGEGETAMFEVVRRGSAMGQVEVDWQITGTANSSLEFVDTQGTDVFAEGENTTYISVVVRADATPELAERYTLTLIEVRTISDAISSGSGAATLDPQASTATITIRASNNPHGELVFQDSSLFVTAQEGDAPQFTIVRQFGTFGAIDVAYMATNGSVTNDADLATAGIDFSSEEQIVRLEDGQQSTVITIPIIDDDAPELDEVFVVQLISVELVGGADGTIAPSLGIASVAEVTIGSNDSPRGTITFTQESYTVQEDVGTVDIVISREQGRVGQVSVVYFITNQQATNGEDFIVEPLDDVVFAAGQDSSTLSIPIVDDSEPEVEEEFCVGLRLPRNGAILGNITLTCVTILPNDDAYGVFSFSQDSLARALQETQGTATTNNVVELRVVRAAGLFGQVTIPFEVVPVEPEGAMTSDISPDRGALLFNPEEEFRIIQLEAVMDDTPELAELFTVVLLTPTNLGRLSSNFTEATIGILPNQDPQGVLEISPVNLPLINGGLNVEEDVQFVNFEVTRNFGTFDEVTVAVQTTAGTAIASEGRAVSAGASQVFNTSSASVSYSFIGSSSGDLFLALGSITEAVLYGWRGVFTPIHTLSANGVTGFTTFPTPEGEDILVVTNGGTPGNREIVSNVYRLTATEELTMIQSLPTVGASEVVSFQPPSSVDWYVVVANGEDNTGNPNVDSFLYRWNGTALELTQRLPTIGASAVTSYTIDGTLYLAVASLTDTRSQVFVWNGGQFRLDHVFDTQQATDIIFSFQGPYLLVTSESVGLTVFVRDEDGEFTANLTLPLQGPVKVDGVTDEGGTLFVVTNSRGPAQLFIATNMITPFEITTVSLPMARHVYPFATPSGNNMLAAVGVNMESQEVSIIYDLNVIDTNNNDFYSKNLTLTFRPGESILQFTISIFNDVIPEIDESFVVSLSMPTGGARIGQSSTTAITILTNDDAHGVIGFADNSQFVIISEMETNFVVTLEVERNAGTFGLIIVDWELSGSHMGGEITPASGQVTFADSISMATITLLIRADDISELDEVTMVTLTRVIENGVAMAGDGSRGARIAPGRNQAVITVQANDDPHGVVTWSPTLVMVDEQEGTNNVIQATLIREFGAIGAVIISYATEMVVGNDGAQSLQDFVPASGDIVMSDGQSSVTISITILPDNIPEPNEIFIVNITDVRLANEADRQGSSTDSPRVNQTGQILEIVIRENDNNRGLLNFNVQSVEVVEMFNSQAIMSVIRTRGTFGSVSVEYAIIPGTASTADYVSPSTNLVVFESSQEAANITVDITNDQIPELDETFEVVLRNSMGGAEIGSPSSVTITILGNDDVNGVFFFADSSLLIVVSESMDAVPLTVGRGISSVGEVTVFWEVATEGQLDLEPTSGNLTFQDGVEEQVFSIRAVQDGIPESFEAYPIRLVSIIGGGRIVDPQESVIAIQASDDPTGVLGLQQFPEGVIVIEGGVLVVGVIRQAGTSGTVTLTWDITPPDATVFATISDTVVLVDGQSQATITVQTLSDVIPEVTRRFTLQVVSVTLARVDVNATTVEVIVPASNNPHGTVEFLSSNSLTVQEGVMPLELSIVRLEGLIGDLRVNYTVVSTSADEMDYSLEEQSVMIPSEMSSAVIVVGIIDDMLPELDETFTISLTSVELLDTSDDLTIPPSLGSATEVAITIQASDDPFGSISISQSMYTVEEGNTLTLELIRVGGTLGVVTVTYATVSGRARSPDDYTDTSGSIVFAQGQTTAQIFVPTVDDQESELVEDFGFELQSVTGGSLGNVTRATIFIAASDSPFGVVGFESTSGFSISNPTAFPSAVTLSVTRTGGAIGSTDISWTVTGPEEGGVPTADIATESITGILTLADGQRSGQIVILVLPTLIDEREEIFTVTLTSATNNVLIDSLLSRTQITVLQNGSPFGVVSFLGDAIRTQQVSEGTTLNLPLERDGDLSVSVDVSYVVTRVDTTDPVQPDVTPVSGIITFPVLQGRASIVLNIAMDDVAELEETFSVTLTGATSGATINPQANTAGFIINANGSPFGEYGIVNASIFADTTGETISRSLTYTVVRRGGDTTSSNIVIQHSFDQDPDAAAIPSMITRSLSASISQLLITLPIPQGTFLYPGSVVTIAISNVTVSSPSPVAGMEADISSTDGTAEVVVADEVANIVVGFTTESLITNVNEAAAVNNVVLSVFRRGQLGSTEVSWVTGTSITAGFVSGSLLPMTGTLQFPPQQNTTTLTLTASAALPHGRAEQFKISLAVTSLDQSFPSLVDSALMSALVDPMGVVQIPSTSYSGIEGTMVSIPVWRRFGSMGSITVTGVASAVSASTLPAQVIPAIPTTDFSSIPISITMEEGVTTAFFNLSLLDNNLVSALKVFQFSLTSVTSNSPSSSVTASPRLSSVNTTTSITIIDDEGGAGQFQLTPTTATLAEGSTFTFNVLRVGGTSGSVSVLVETQESGSATSGADYQAFRQELLFTSGVSQLLMSVDILDDDISEGPEDFRITLSAPDGDALVDPNANTLNVVIEASDNPAGVFSFLTASLVLSESGPSSGELEVRRIGNLVGVVTIGWEAVYTDGEEHPVPIDTFLVNSRGTITFGDNSATSDANILLQLIPNAVPSTGEQFSVRLSSVTPGVGFGVPVEAVVTVQPRIVSTLNADFSNLTIVVSTSQQVSILIKRTDGLQTTAVVNYNTSQPRQPVSVGSLKFQPAQPHVHFTQIQTTVTFNPGDISHLINIPIIFVPDTPVAFVVQISSTGHTIVNGTITIVISPPVPVTSLLSIYTDALDILTSQDLERVATEMLTLLNSHSVSGQDNTTAEYTQLIIETMIQKSLLPVNIDYSNSSYVTQMLDIFQSLLIDVSFSERSIFVVSMQKFAYSLLEDSQCNGIAIVHSRPQFYLQTARFSPSVLAGRNFSSSSGLDYVQFPQVIPVQVACFNVAYIEFLTNNLFVQPTLQSKVLSLSVQGVTITPSTSDPVIYRIYTDQNLGVIPDQDDCLLWRGNQWDNSVCTPQTHFVLQENFIQCACSELGDVAIAADLNIGYGWTFPAGISAAIVIIAVLLVMIIHFRYFSRTQLATRILMCLCFSIFLFQLILLVDIFASDSAGLSANGCAALGALLQFTAVAQFLWIAAMAIALWANFVGCTSGNEPLAIYIVVSWGIAILIVVVTLLIGRFAANFELTSSDGLYGLIGDLCFVPHLSVSLLSIVLPVILSLLAMVALTSYTCFYWSRWEDIKSLYYDSFNRTEIPLLLGFFGLIFLSSLAAYLHVYIGLTYTFGAFIILNTLEGLYALVVYFFVSWHTLTRKHDKYNVGDEVEALEVPGDEEYFGSLSLSSLGSSKEQLVQKDLQEQPLDHSSPESGVVSIGMRQLNSDFSHKPPYVPLGEENKDDSHMDDLLFMLKTQNFSPGSVGSDESEPSIVRPRQNRSGAGTEHFERRRISIADTHL